jgi:hypothetical protein
LFFRAHCHNERFEIPSFVGKSANLPPAIALSRPDTLSAEPIPNTVDEAVDALGRGLSGIDFRTMKVLSADAAVASRTVSRSGFDGRGSYRSAADCNTSWLLRDSRMSATCQTQF